MQQEVITQGIYPEPHFGVEKLTSAQGSTNNQDTTSMKLTSKMAGAPK